MSKPEKETRIRFSVLDAVLLLQRKSPEGHILITPNEAKDVLITVLHAFYKRETGKAPRQLARNMDSRIEALVEISRGKSEQDNSLYDLSERVEQIEEARAKAYVEDLDRGLLGGEIVPRDDTQNPL